MRDGKLRILHTGDIHLGELAGPTHNGDNLRMMDTIECMNDVFNTAAIGEVDLILIDGDLTNKSKLWGEQTMREYQILGHWIGRLSTIATVVVTFGTKSHDLEECYKALEQYKFTAEVHIARTPQLLKVYTRDGIEVQVACLPGLDKGHFRAMNPGIDPTLENQMCSDGLADILRMFAAEFNPTAPAILAAHYTVVGSQYDNGNHVFMESEVVLRPTDIDAAGFTLATLGHIHRAQRIEYCSTPAFYCGAINGLTFNEENQEKGVWIHELECKGDRWEYSDSSFVATPYRRFLTINMDEEAVLRFIDGDVDAAFAWMDMAIQDKIVRVKFECDVEANKKLDRAKLERDLYAAGAFWVASIEPKQSIQELDTEGMSESTAPAEALQQWFRTKDFPQAEYHAMTELAAPLIAQVSAKQPAGKLTGIFEPLELTVRNYRSYLEESFDFSRVRFATVNGPNGVGKSAFFSDAIRDALYEEPREGELTGWINSDDDVRSGSIEFTFRMGVNPWKVTRTRTKGGKTTLALSELVEEKWEDRSGEGTKETQEKIIALLGMDSMTFRSCVLIMQDAYAVFLEADKTDRMKVLGDTMGLGVYEDLEKLAKDKLTETNRRLRAAQDKLRELDKQMEPAQALLQEEQEINESLKDLVQQIDDQDEKLVRQKSFISMKEDKAKDADELDKKAGELREQVSGKITSRKQLQAKLTDAEALLADEAIINAASVQFEALRTEIITLKAKVPQKYEAERQEISLVGEHTRIKNDLASAEKKLQDASMTPETRQNIIDRAEEAKTLSKQLEEMDQKCADWNKANREVQNRSSEKGRTALAGENDLASRRELIRVLTEKTMMLENAECIDIEKAGCRFLKDAITAKAQLEIVRQEFTAAQTKVANDNQKAVEDWEAAVKARDEIKYDDLEHQKLKDKYQRVKPFEAMAAGFDATDKLIAELNSTITGLKSRLEETDKQVKDASAKVQELRAELEPLLQKENTMESLKDLVKKKDEIPAAKEVKAMAESRIKELDEEIERITKEGVDMVTKAKAIREQLSDLEQLKADQTTMETALNTLHDQEKNHHTRIGAIKHQQKQIENFRKEWQEQKDEEAKEAKTATRYQTLTEAFSQDGIPFQIIRTIVPELQDTANSILGQMTGGRMEIEMRTERVQKNKKEVNALEVWIKRQGKNPMPYLSHSGGQRVKVALSTVFGIAHLKAKRAGIQLGMMFVDEPPFLDDDGTQAYCDALESMAMQFPSMKLLAMSHDQSMKARFPQQITVEATEQGSKITFAA